MTTRLAKHREASAVRRATNVSLDERVVADARSLGINVSRACQAGLDAAISGERRKRWLEENREAIAASNAWVDKHGLPLEKYRL